MQLITGSQSYTNVVHSRAGTSVSVEQFSMAYLQLQAGWIALELHPSPPFIHIHIHPLGAQNPELVAAAQTENGRKEGSPWPGWVFAPVVYFYSSLPCAWVHLSRKTMNTKRKSILQFFTVFRLKINWLKKLSTSTYLPSPTPGTHTHKYTPAHRHRGATPAGI